MHTLSWYTKRGRLLQPTPFVVVGIVNITPDSFSDGGKNASPTHAFETILKMISDGAHCIDIGAESTRPGAESIGAEREKKRLYPLFNLLKNMKEENDTCFSLDTFRAETAKWALQNNAVSVINDISGGLLDPGMMDVISQFKPGYVIGHCPCLPKVMQENPFYDDIVDTLLSFFTERLTLLINSGVPEGNIALDPCIGFGKNLEHNLQIIRNIERLNTLGRPLYFGISRKSLFRDLVSADPIERDILTQSLTSILATKGVLIHRIHDVKTTVKTLHVVSKTVCNL